MCWLWHKWGKWSNPVKAVVANGSRTGKRVWVQQRACDNCNQVGYRYVAERMDGNGD